MNKKQKNNLKEIYNLLQLRQENLNSLYKLLKKDDKRVILLEKMAKACNIKLRKNNRLAFLTRVINLRENSLVQVLKNENLQESEIEKSLENIYKIVSKYHIKRHKNLLNIIEKRELLNLFYTQLLKGVHEIGICLTLWQPLWNKTIILQTNKQLLREYKSDGAIIEMLKKNNLLDKNPDGSFADRSYSALVNNGDNYLNLPYALAFPKQVCKVVKILNKLIEKLLPLKDDIFNSHEEYIKYLETLKSAFKEKKNDNLIHAWQDVDRAWMSVKSPIQVGHPLEYYEDHYKKAVALEWDVRFADPKNVEANETKIAILSMYKNLFLKANNNKFSKIYTQNVLNIEKTQLYISRPFLFYGAEFNGLFSAQVVPNDESVSSQFGKKIFAFGDNVLSSIRAKPFMKISGKIFPKEFLKIKNDLVFGSSKTWHKIYEITTIGHEFGHILWIDEDSETLMNKSGMFKNIEEFKATTSGLVSFFQYGDKKLLSHVMNDTIKRAVELISWMESPEVVPYYCESLIHLSILFNSGAISFNGKKLQIHNENINFAKNLYIETYLDLAKVYLKKEDAKIFLEQFVQKDGKNFMPKEPMVKQFVEYYYALYKEIGQKIV